MVFQSAYGCPPYFPPEGFVFYLCPRLSPPPRESALAESAECFSALAKWIVDEIDCDPIGIRLFAVSSARGFVPFASREYLPRLGNPFGPSRMNDSAIWLRCIINEIDGVSMDIRLLVFPSPEGLLSSLTQIISLARGLRSGRVG